MKKGDIEKVESIKRGLPNILKKFQELIDEGCINNCEECFLSKVVIKEGVPYEYARGKLYGPLTICDFLGILLEEVGDAILP